MKTPARGRILWTLTAAPRAVECTFAAGRQRATLVPCAAEELIQDFCSRANRRRGVAGEKLEAAVLERIKSVIANPEIPELIESVSVKGRYRAAARIGKRNGNAGVGNVSMRLRREGVVEEVSVTFTPGRRYGLHRAKRVRQIHVYEGADRRTGCTKGQWCSTSAQIRRVAPGPVCVRCLSRYRHRHQA